MATEQVKAISNNNGTLTIGVSGRIDTNNANEIEQEVDNILTENEYENLILDLSELEYISSVGIRILVKLSKNNPGFKIENTTNEVYDVLAMTGINTVIPVSKKMREFSVEGLEKIGAGFNGVVYRLDDETILKVITNGNLETIQNERNVAQKTFLMGIPSAISFDVVKVGDDYGIIYELLDSETFQSRIQNNKDRLPELGRKLGQFANKVNSMIVEDDSFGDAKDRLLAQLEGLKSRLGNKGYESIKEVLTALPESANFIHGDIQPGNIIIQNDEPLLIDMATVGKGHPIIDIMSLAVILVGSVYSHPEDDFVPFVNDLTKAQNLKLYDAFLRGYFNTEDKDYLESVKKKIFPFMLATKAMGMVNYLPEPSEDNQDINYSEDNISSKVATLGLEGIVNEINECLEDMTESFKELEQPVEF